MFSQSFFRLPFVMLPSERCDDWGEFWQHANMWNDEPTGNDCGDYHRGKKYARDAIEATVKDGAQSRQLEIVVERILERAFRRRGPKGSLCRKLSSAEDGFLHELCRVAIDPHDHRVGDSRHYIAQQRRHLQRNIASSKRLYPPCLSDVPVHCRFANRVANATEDVNLKTARALGLDISPTLLARADEVIE